MNAQFSDERNVKIVSIYFDYKSRDGQNAINLAKNILRQLLSDVDDIPAELESLHFKPDKPLKTLTVYELLGRYSRRYSTIYAIFDAIDESAERCHSEVVDLLCRFERLGYRLLVSGRPGSPLNTLRDKFTSSRTFQIIANDSDLESYVCSRVPEGKLRTKSLKMVKAAGGLYIFLPLQNLNFL
jgi:hypothetical protein